MNLQAALQALLFESSDNNPEFTCMPWAIPQSERCDYITTHLNVCGEGTGLVPYMRIHYCTLDFSPFLSHVLLSLWIFLLFLALMVVTEHFFCPALEVISDFFKLPENVAGATLLSFGNGAPDFFTQLAAIATMDSSSVPIAIGEPIGGGLFVSNIVLGAVVFIAGGSSGTVLIEKKAFLRDSCFYAGSMLVVGLVLYDEQVNMLEAILMCCYYALFVLYIALFDSKGASPMHIEHSQHYQDVMRSTSSQTNLSPRSYPIAPSPLGLASAHALPARAEAVQALGAHARRNSSLSGGLGQPSNASIPSQHLSAEEDSTDGHVPIPPEPSASGVPPPITGTSQLTTSTANAPATDPLNPFLPKPTASPPIQPPPGVGVPQPTTDYHRSNNGNNGCGSSGDLERSTEVTVTAPIVDEIDAPLLPITLPQSTLFLTPIDTGSDPVRPFHSAEVVSGHGGQEEGGSGGSTDLEGGKKGLMHRLSWPIICLARLTMPEVGMADHVTYPKMYAVLLPITAPLFVVFAKKLALAESSPLGPDALLYGFVCSGFSSLVIASIYPADGKHYGVLSGLFTAMAFAMSVLWMNVASAEMVRAWKVLGYIHGISQGMLGVTVLAWVNSAGDYIADTTMARDGFPGMAVAACFASPFFTMIAGLGLTFLFAVSMHGTVTFEPGIALKVALMFAAASVVRHIVMVPLVHGWKLTKSSAIGMFAFYAAFQVVYLALIVMYP